MSEAVVDVDAAALDLSRCCQVKRRLKREDLDEDMIACDKLYKREQARLWQM